MALYCITIDLTTPFIDLYLYFLLDKLGYDKDDVILGGYGWSYSTKKPIEDFDFYEYKIRYSYGYNKTKYGQLMIQQQVTLRKHEVIVTGDIPTK